MSDLNLRENKPLQFNQVTTPSFPIKSNLNQNDAFHETNDGNDTWLRQPSATTFQFANSFHSKELPPSAYKATNGISFTAATNSQMPATSYSPSNIQPHKLNRDADKIKNMKPTNIRITFDTSPMAPFNPNATNSRSTMTSASNSNNNTPLPTTTLSMQNTPTQSRMLLIYYLFIISYLLCRRR